MRQNQKPNSLPKSIETIDDVWDFFNYLHKVEGVNFHPEQDFDDYIHGTTHKPTYAKREVKERNRLMEQCFNVCAKNGFDIFRIGIEAQKRNLFNEKSNDSGEKNTNIAVCILTEDYVESDTGLVYGFSKNKSYKILYDHPLWVNIGHPDVESSTFQRWEFEKHFRYAEEGEMSLGLPETEK